MIWVLALIVSEIILLCLPIYIYDQYFWQIIVFASFVQIFFIGRIETVLLERKKTTGLILLVFLFSYLNYFVYDYRKESAFLYNTVKVTTGTVIDEYSHEGVRTTTRYYIEYEFTANMKRYQHVDEVKFWVWFNYKINKKLKIEYVADNPKISRIHKSSLVEYPRRKELMKSIQEDYNRNNR